MSTTVKVPIKVQKRSGFDKSHHHAFSQKVGTITPLLVDELIPNSKVNLRYALAGSLPPLATDTYMKVNYDIRAFFIPFRLLAGGFESWFADYEFPIVESVSPYLSSIKSFLPWFSIDKNADITGIIGKGTLSDYLGYKTPQPTSLNQRDSAIEISAMPFLAYHRICSDWYRQSNITKDFFARSSSYAANTGDGPYSAASSPFFAPASHYNACMHVVTDLNDINLLLADNVSVFSLRQANFDYDYFTNALASPQHGSPMTVASVNDFTIASLRVANSLQQWSELNALAGGKLVDVVRARYGAKLHDSIAQRSVYLGGARLDFGTKSVDIRVNAGAVSTNPFSGTAGASAGKAYIQGTDLIIDGFTAEEPGYIFVLGTIIPKVTYAAGVRRYLRHYIAPGSLTDMANPMLQNVGNQPIYDFELTSSVGFNNQNNVFGYTDRYADFMTFEDVASGELGFSGSLYSFLAQRFFLETDDPKISTAFLEVPTSALDNITAVSGQISQFGFYGQIAFDYKVSMPLAQYSLPSLQNPAYEHGETIMVHRGGFRF